MNRASLLHILDHTTGISEVEVRELEQLAVAFPYCQTAHLLLAKAAHDRGSMLAGQRLRRAATYAADRELLRALIELPAPEVPVTPLLSAPVNNEAEVNATPEPLIEPTEIEAQLRPAATAPEAPAARPEEPTDESLKVEADVAAPASEANHPTEMPDEAPMPPTAAQVSEEVAAGDEALEPALPVLAEAIVDVRAQDEPLAPLATTAPAPPPQENAEPALAEAVEELPAAAPLIRPPVEVGSSRFEFGLSEAPITGPAYQLPELPEEPAVGTIPPLRADEHLAYALSAGSRMGACLTLRAPEFTHDLPLADNWHPDAVVLAHVAAHRAALPVVPSSLALIDKFLRSQPRIKSAAARPAPTEAPQADLSVRSTSAAPSLASESLAKIMVRQGKTARAIEIYEQLMQRQPEKKAYFAAQIDLLNQQPE
ncbi:hypothetical protein GCM10027048_39180 [Hymenobacter coalescens]